ncbi:hypothetical protein AAMO2058_000430100 [Amorphochlora amoebiformis]
MPMRGRGSTWLLLVAFLGLMLHLLPDNRRVLRCATLDYSKWDNVDTDDGQHVHEDRPHDFKEQPDTFEKLRNLDPETVANFASSKQGHDLLTNPKIFKEICRNDPSIMKEAAQFPEFAKLLEEELQKEEDGNPDTHDSFFQSGRRRRVEMIRQGRELFSQMKENYSRLYGEYESQQNSQENISPQHIRDLRRFDSEQAEMVLNQSPRYWNMSKEREAQSKEYWKRWTTNGSIEGVD